MVTDLGPKSDIPENDIKWVLGNTANNKASRGDGIPEKLFKIIKGDAVKVPANLESPTVATRLEKIVLHPSPKGQCQRIFKLLNKCTHLTHGKIMLKILQVSIREPRTTRSAG